MRIYLDIQTPFGRFYLLSLDILNDNLPIDSSRVSLVDKIYMETNKQIQINYYLKIIYYPFL
jgi:hypothetical protein